MSDEPKFTMPKSLMRYEIVRDENGVDHAVNPQPVDPEFDPFHTPPGQTMADLARDEDDEPEPDVSRAATGSVPAIDPARTGKHLATQTEYPWRTALLHAGSTTIASLVAVASVIGDERVQDLINRYVPGQAAGVIAFGVGCGLVAGTLSRIANLPAVAALRTKIGLGPIAKKNLTR